MTMFQKSGTNLLLCAAVCAVQFAAFEFALRAWGGTEAAPAFQRLFMADPAIGYRLKPGVSTRFETSEFVTDIRINAAGTRDDEIGPKGPGEFRIVVLGDSLVMAVQVPLAQTFCRVLQDRLNQDAAGTGRRFRVINAGVQGYGPVEQYLFFRDVARRFDADLVVVALYVANDAIEAAASAYRLGTGATTEGTSQSGIREPWYTMVRRIVRRSMVLQVVRLRIRSLAEHFGRAPDIAPALRTYLPEASDDVVSGLAVTRDAMTRLAALAGEHGARTGLVLLPARFQVDDTDFGYLTRDLAVSGYQLVRDAGTDRFRAGLAPLGLPTWDALPALRDGQKRDRVFFVGTAHLTPYGHTVLADGIRTFLGRTGLLPSSRP